MIQADSAGAIAAETEADLLGLVLTASPETKVVLVLCAIFSLLVPDLCQERRVPQAQARQRTLS
jgi:hypothetical protein